MQTARAADAFKDVGARDVDQHELHAEAVGERRRRTELVHKRRLVKELKRDANGLSTSQQSSMRLS